MFNQKYPGWRVRRNRSTIGRVLAGLVGFGRCHRNFNAVALPKRQPPRIGAVI